MDWLHNDDNKNLVHIALITASISLSFFLLLFVYVFFLYLNNKNNTIQLINKVNAIPLFGRWVVLKLVGFVSPYTANTGLVVEHLSPTSSRISIKQRRSIENPFGSIHLAALTNLAEVAAGLLVVQQLANTKRRGIPIAVDSQFLRKARGKITAVAEVNDIPQNCVEYETKTTLYNAQEDVVCIVKVKWIISSVEKKTQ